MLEIFIYASVSISALKNLEKIQKFFMRRLFYRLNPRKALNRITVQSTIGYVFSPFASLAGRTSSCQKLILTYYKIFNHELNVSLQVTMRGRCIGRGEHLLLFETNVKSLILMPIQIYILTISVLYKFS